MNKRNPSVFAALFAACLLLASIASAEPIKIKFQDLAELGGSLRSLDGVDREVKTSDQGVRILRTPFDLKPSARISIAKDLSAVRAALDAFEQQRQALLQRVSPGAIEKVQTDVALLGKFAQLWTDLVKEPVTIDVATLSEADLNLEANKEITGTILAGLAPVLAPAKR